MVIVGGREAHLMTDMLVKYDIPVILDRIHRLPNTADQDVIYHINKLVNYNKQACK